MPIKDRVDTGFLLLKIRPTNPVPPSPKFNSPLGKAGRLSAVVPYFSLKLDCLGQKSMSRGALAEEIMPA